MANPGVQDLIKRNRIHIHYKRGEKGYRHRDNDHEDDGETF